MNFIGVDVHKERLTVANIDENFNIEFIDNMNTQELIEYVKSRKSLIIAVDAPYKLGFEYSQLPIILIIGHAVELLIRLIMGSRKNEHLIDEYRGKE